jgi:hypothetical protein
MPIMFRGYFKANLWKMFAKLSYIYIHICAKQVLKAMIQRVEKEIARLYVRWKKYSLLDGSMHCNIC